MEMPEDEVLGLYVCRHRKRSDLLKIKPFREERTRYLVYNTRTSHVLLFWAAFILTRPLGATVGDFFDKPFDKELIRTVRGSGYSVNDSP